MLARCIDQQMYGVWLTKDKIRALFKSYKHPLPQFGRQNTICNKKRSTKLMRVFARQERTFCTYQLWEKLIVELWTWQTRFSFFFLFFCKCIKFFDRLFKENSPDLPCLSPAHYTSSLSSSNVECRNGFNVVGVHKLCIFFFENIEC